MKKSLTKKVINGRSYYYLAYRKGKKVHTDYLGPDNSPKYKKYLFKLTEEAGEASLIRARRKNHAAGVPIVYLEDGYLVYEYKNGAKEYLDHDFAVVKVSYGK